jgi:hydroxyacylglutathione hydrolase
MKKKHSEILVKKFTVGSMAENCYVVVDTISHEALVIDPGDEASYLAEQLEKLEAKPIAILATHGHFDHVLAACELQMIYQIPFRMMAEDQFLLDRMSETAEQFLGHRIVEIPPRITQPLNESEEIHIGTNSMHVFATPGHTPGSCSLYLKKESILFVGDTIFAAGGVGRTDFSYSKKDALYASIKHILSLPNETKLYPGHGEETTVLAETVYYG